MQVPDEVYLVIPRKGGRDDYAALFHEGGHTEHYANVDAALPFEFRYLGDNSVTEGFAFLLEHLTEDPGWLEVALGVTPTDGYLDYVRASKLVFLRRYAAKLAYELELHAGRASARTRCRELYARPAGRSGRRRVAAASPIWPTSTTATTSRTTCGRGRSRPRFAASCGSGSAREWFSSAEAGELLRSIWREGQRLDGGRAARPSSPVSRSTSL